MDITFESRRSPPLLRAWKHRAWRCRIIGLDTLTLRLTEWEISSHPHLVLEQPKINYRTDEVQSVLNLWPDGRGGYSQGVRAYYDGDPSLDFKLGPLGVGREYGAAVGAWVEFSVPRRAEGHNFTEVDQEGTRRAIMGVQQQLDDIGVKANLRTAVISRADIKQAIETDEPFLCYANVFDLVQCSRMPVVDYGTTFRYSNSQQQLAFYDKVAEMKAKAIKTGRRTKTEPQFLPYSGNWLQAEQRMTKPRKVQTELGVETVGELLLRYERVGECYRETMQKYVFGRTVEEVEGSSQRNLEADMARFKAKYSRQWLQHYFAFKGLEALIKVNRPEIVAAALANVAGSETEEDKQRIRRLKKQLEAARWELAELQPAAPSARTIGELYRELQDKVLAIN